MPAIKRLHIHLRTLHRWLAFLVGLQVIAWVGGGLVMSLLDIEMVRGRHLQEKLPREALDRQRLVPLAALPVEGVLALSLKQSALGPVYEVEGADGEMSRFDAYTGAQLRLMDETEVMRLAGRQYRGEAAPESVLLLHSNSTEYRGPLPVYRVNFADGRGTSFYLNPQTGDLLSVRTDIWRLFDFMWMLHIMDYRERENFNHPLLWLFASAALLFVLSGTYLSVRHVGMRIRQRKTKSGRAPVADLA